MIGQRIGSYTIVEKLGEGGMGVVYRATDSRLHRDVALKFIPEALAKDAQTMGRFEREAQLLASLNHPNIAAIYGVEESDGQRALVMELAGGEELASRIQRGKIPLEEALRIALAIADALEAAHDKGVIHRDLKPANVKLGSPSDSGGGRIKILDFGLAKALQGDLGSSSSVDLTRSPALSVAATQAGMILGTASYMSPEQARAMPADRRADIWSFGVILFEMLAGQRAFRGDTVADTVAKVIERDPEWSALPATTPPAIRNLIERCLVKNTRQRLQAIGDARLVLEEALLALARPLSADAAPAAAPAPAAAQPVAVGTRRGLVILPWALAALALAWAVFLALRPTPRAPPADSPLAVELAIGQEDLYAELGPGFAVSPEGATLAYIETIGSRRRLRIRSLEQLEAMPVAVDESSSNGPYHPFFSPGGEWVGYATPGELKKVQVGGGAPVKICTVARSRGATWVADDTIVFTPDPASGLFRVPATGGEPQPLTTLDEEANENTHRWPQSLPGVKHVLFTSNVVAPTYDNANLEVVSLETRERKVVHRGGSFGRYVASGHLVFVNGSTLFAIPFDLDTLATRGSAVPVLQNLASTAGEGAAQFDISDTGRLIYSSETAVTTAYPIAWADRDGRSSTLLDEPGFYTNPQLSPDGTRVALTVLRDGNWDIWVYDVARGVPTRLTFDDATESEQVWSPDGQYLIFSSDGEGPDSLYRKRADGSGETERMTQARVAQWATSISPDGRWLTYMENKGQYDLVLFDLETKETTTLLDTPAGEGFAEISPDGRYLAYASNESGAYQVYVRPFPSGQGKWQVSDDPGTTPRWRADGRELFWRDDEGILAATVETDGPTFRAGRPQRLFSGPWRGGINGIGAGGLAFSDFDVSPDGQRFVMFPDEGEHSGFTRQHLTLQTRWFEQLESISARAAK